MPRERGCGVLNIRRGVPIVPLAGADNFRMTVASDVHPAGGLVVGDIQRDMALPMGGDAFAWVLEPPGILARETQDQNVGPTVAVDVGRMSEEIGTVFVLIAQPAFVTAEGHLGPVSLALGNVVGRSVFVAHLEGGAFIPEWAGDHIGHTVPVNIPKTCALRPKLIAQFLFEKRVKPRRRGLGMQVGAPG